MRPPGSLVQRVAVTVTALLAVSSFGARPHDRAPTPGAIDSLLNAARYDTARALTVTALHEAEAHGDSAAVGSFAFRLGRVSVTLGDQAIARRELDRAIRLTEAARDTADLAQALLFRGFVHRDMKEFDEAMANFERARDLSHRAHIASAEGDATYNIAYRELRVGNLDAARPGYLRAMKLWQSTGDPFLIASGGNALGNLYTVLGEVDSARYWYNQTLEITRTHHFPFYELWAHNNLGDLGRRLGNYELALYHYRAALAIGRRIGFDRGVALPSMNMALALSYLGQRDLAFQYLDECLAVCQRAGFKDLEVVNTIVAGVLNLEAERSGEAAAYFRRILNMEYVYETNRRSEAAYGLSMALAQMDSVEAAIAVLEPFVSPRARAVNNLGQPYFEMGYANLLRRAGRCQEALPRIHTLQADLGTGSASALAVFARLVESSCRRQLGDRAGAAGALTMALDSLEVARSQFGQADVREAYGLHVMSDVIEGCRVLIEYPDTEPPGERVRAFYDALQRFKTRTLLDRIRAPRSDELATLGTSVARPVTATRLQTDVLEPGELLLDLVVSKDESFMFAVTADSCRLVPLPGWKSDLAEKVALYADLLSAPSGKTRDDYSPERLAATQRALAGTILGPVADLIAGARRIIFAPDGFYAAIPLGTLVADDGGMLLESKDVTYVPSASVLEWTRAERARGVNEGASMVAVTDESAAALSGARHETDQLRRRYADVELVSARAGVLDTLVQRARPNCILHVAAHARVNDESPWQSGFLLARSSTATDSSAERSASASYDTFLRAWEIARSQLPYDMAVLAGCETAAGRATNGEGVLGLTSAFLSAGVPVIVSSLWPVDDRATATLMGHFYDRLAVGETVASALRGAQLAVRGNRGTSHPFYWAGFAVVGDGSRVIPPRAIERKHRIWMSVAAIAGMAIGLAGWTLWRRRPTVPSAS